MSRAQGLKNAFARTFTALGADRVLSAAQSAALGGRFVRMINYHGTPPEDARLFESHVALFARRFVNASPAALLALVRDGRWDAPRPGVVVSFDDALRSNYDVAAPILERHGLRGWFFVPSMFPDVPPADQRAFAREHRLAHMPAHLYPDGRVCMTWDELAHLASRGHVIGSHTASHQRLRTGLSPARLDAEIAGSRQTLQRRLGFACESFCWVGGERESYSSEAARAVRDAGYELSFMTCSAPATRGTDPLQLHRTNIESPWPRALARVHISGLTDLYYRSKRRWVNRLTRA